MFGQGRDGLDWHRLVLGGQRGGETKSGGLTLCKVYRVRRGVLIDEDPYSSVSAEQAPPTAADGRSVRCVSLSLCLCVLVCVRVYPMVSLPGKAHSKMS